MPHESYLYVEINAERKGNQIPGEVLPKYIDNFGAYIFDELRYELNGFEIDHCKNVGVTSTLKGYATLSNNQKTDSTHTSWGMSSEKTVGNVSFCLLLKYVFGFCEDYRKIIMNAKHELILVRSRNDYNSFYDAPLDNATLKIKKSSS